ncbi:MAG TPA: TrkH family potassium uptake protein, partial [Noviherbaspirillum sp.]|nr:TrkH family potassium uptake protein [Noviherbaspirillum sp.]
MRSAPTAQIVDLVERRVLSLTPPQALFFSFFALSLVGTLLLKLPAATTSPISWMQALFTATSAATVTGLVVVDTGTQFTLTGQLILLALLQLGGLGFMSFGVFIISLARSRLNLGQRAVMREALNQSGSGDMRRLLRRMFVFTVVIELVGTLLLATKWVPELGWGRGLYHSFFHAISAFNNGGFVLDSDSLMSEVGSPIVNIVITGLFISGGIGFVVVADMMEKQRFSDYTLHTKLMLFGTAILSVVGMLVLFILEYGNPDTLGGLASLSDQLWAAWFASVTPRSAGFNTIDTGAMTEASALFTMVLMFIGGGAGSTAGGIKLTTFIVILLTARAFLLGHDRPVVFGRSLDYGIIIRALTVSVIWVIAVILGTFILTLTESARFIDIAFEVTSAGCTVGLSRGITPDLSPIGQATVIGLMLIGRAGPLALAFVLVHRYPSRIQY